jgi:hypothetical protein
MDAAPRMRLAIVALRKIRDDADATARLFEGITREADEKFIASLLRPDSAP